MQDRLFNDHRIAKKYKMSEVQLQRIQAKNRQKVTMIIMFIALNNENLLN